jgi:hypothetical protein
MDIGQTACSFQRDFRVSFTEVLTYSSSIIIVTSIWKAIYGIAMVFQVTVILVCDMYNKHTRKLSRTYKLYMYLVIVRY